MTFIRIGTTLAIIFFIAAGFMVRQLVNAEEEKSTPVKQLEVRRSKIVAKRDLPAFTLLTDKDVEVRQGTGDADLPDVGKLTNRYLFAGVKQGGEVKDENLAPRAATDVLDDATAFSIPASSTTALGGQLRVGDVVQLFAVHANGNTVPAKENGAVQRFDEVVVLNIVPASKDTNAPGTITLAVPTAQHDSFAAAAGGTQLFVTKKIEVHRPIERPSTP